MENGNGFITLLNNSDNIISELSQQGCDTCDSCDNCYDCNYNDGEEDGN